MPKSKINLNHKNNNRQLNKKTNSKWMYKIKKKKIYKIKNRARIKRIKDLNIKHF